MFIDDLNLNKKDRVHLIIAILFSLMITLKLIDFHSSGGIYFPDKALYLISSLYYAGMDYYHIIDLHDLFYSPIISFLTSLLFRAGLVDQAAISIVTAIFGFLGFIGFYIFLRNRFNPLLCLTGVVIFGSLSVVLLNLSSGLLDIPSTAISIWVLVFAIMAIDKNPKYFLISFPLLVIGFFTRYTSGFVLPLIILYYLMKRDLIQNIDYLLVDKQIVKEKLLKYLKTKEFKYLLISFLFSIILVAIICKFFILDYGGSLTFLEQSVNTFNGHKASTTGIDVVYNKLYYLENFSKTLFHNQRSFNLTLARLLYTILGVGSLFGLISVFKNRDKINYKNSYKTKYFDKILISLVIILFILVFLSFKVLSNHMMANIFLLMSLVILFSLIKNFDVNVDIQALNILTIAYFLIYLIFMSIFPTKDTRYALPLIPPFIYFIIWGLNNIIEYLKDYKSILNINTTHISKLIPILIIGIFMISTFSFVAPLKIEKKPVKSIDFINYKGSPNDLLNATQCIIDNDLNYHSKTFASNYHNYRMIKWYLKENVTFINEDPNLIDKSGVDYAILNNNVHLKNYHIIYNCSDFYVYYKNKQKQ